MSRARCTRAVPFGTLVDYWLDDPPSADPEELEEHLFACEECSAALEAVAAFADAIRRLGRKAPFRGGLGPAILGRMERDRRVIRRYRARAGGHIHCTARADDDLVALELSADLAGVERVDLLYCAEDGTLLERARQVPVIRGRGVVWAESGDVLRKLPTGISYVRLLAVEPAGDRLVGEYTLHHTAYRP